MNEQKTPLARTLPLFVDKKIREWIDKQGKAMPGHVVAVNGAIVTVNFDVQGLVLPLVQMPLFGAEYIRWPIQQGSLGVCFPVDFGIGGVSGLGLPGATDTTRPGNLAALVWIPVGNKSWTLPPGADADTLALYGHLTTLLLDSLAGNSSIKLSANGITLTFGSTTITMNSTGITLVAGGKTVVLNSSGLTIDGILWETHKHAGTGSLVAGSTPVTGFTAVPVSGP